MPIPPKMSPEQREAARQKAVAAYIEKCRIVREARARRMVDHVIGAGDEVRYSGWVWKVGRVDAGYAFIHRAGREKRVPVGALELKKIAK
jgi:hypothetical protein